MVRIQRTNPFRRRAAGIAFAAAMCGSLVALPVIGLIRIDNSTEESHRYTALVSTTDDLTNDLLGLGPVLTSFGTTGSESSRAAVVAAVEAARAKLRQVEVGKPDAVRWGFADELEAHLALARVVFDTIDRFIAEIDGGLRVPAAPSAAAVSTSIRGLVPGQGHFTDAASPAALELDQDRRDAMREAQALLFVALGVALAAFIALGIIDTRRVGRLFASETARREEAERSAAQRADVVNMASHELRNPLTIMMLTTSMLAEAAAERGDDELAMLAADARTAAARSELLVDELLDLGRIDADRLELAPRRTPVRPAVDDAVALTASQHGVRPVLVDGLPDLAVFADPQRLRLILRNLVDNAFKYSPAGSPIQVHVVPEGDRVAVEVVDEGAGIAESDRERIFGRFERLSAGGDIPGIGIGLYLSRELARRMQGELSCADSNHGTSFRLVLPAVAS
jgi:signal transduction histidine kinase